MPDLPADVRVERNKSYLTVETDTLKVRLNCRRGLAIDALWFKDISEDWLCGTMHHGYYDDINWGPITTQGIWFWNRRGIEGLPILVGSLRLGHTTINPEALSQKDLFYSVHNTGNDPEYFKMIESVSYGDAVSFLIPAKHVLGCTDAIIKLGDHRHHISVIVTSLPVPRPE